MGTSTDAMLFYGYHLPEDVELSDDVKDRFMHVGPFADSIPPIQIDYHCSDECSMPYVYWTASHIVAARGRPQPVDQPLQDRLLTNGGTDVDVAIRAFATEHGIPGPGEAVDPDWPPDWPESKASELGWWLVSWWG